MNLTELETKILNHRLEVPDAIVDALNGEEDENIFFPDDIDDICEMLLEGSFLSAQDYSYTITEAVLVDCVDGSTYWGASKTNGDSNQKLGAIERAGNSLVKKIRAFTDHEEAIVFPTY